MADKYVTKIKTKNNDVYTIRDESTYNKAEIDSKIAKALANILNFKRVDTLPDISKGEKVDPHAIYVVKRTDGVPNGDVYDKYDEYIYLENTWEFVGNRNLSEYTKTNNLIDKLNELKYPQDLFKSNVNKKITIDGADELLIRHYENNDSQVYSMTVDEFINLITNNNYIKNSTKPISAKGLNGYIKIFRATNLNLSDILGVKELNGGESQYRTQSFNGYCHESTKLTWNDIHGGKVNSILVLGSMIEVENRDAKITYNVVFNPEQSNISVWAHNLSEQQVSISNLKINIRITYIDYNGKE